MNQKFDIEDLKTQFEVKKDDKRIGVEIGDLIIPIEHFDFEWDEELLNLGYECEEIGPNIIYRRITDFAPATNEKPKKGRPPPRGPSWTRKEIDYLIELYNHEPHLTEDKISREFAKRYSRRKGTAVHNKIRRLINAGKIKPKHSHKKNIIDSPSQRKPETEVSTDPIFSEISSIKKQLSALTGVLEEIVLLINKQGCQIMMSNLQIEELQGELKIPGSLWVHYANVMLENDKKFCDLFQAKVKHFWQFMSEGEK